MYHQGFYLANIIQSFKLLIFFSKSQKKWLRILTGTGTGTHYKYRLFNIDSAISYALATFKAHLTTRLVPILVPLIRCIYIIFTGQVCYLHYDKRYTLLL